MSKKDVAYNAKLKHTKPLDLMFGGENFENEEQETPKRETSNTIAIEQIQLDPNQPRRYFDEKKLSELAQSILELGILEPLIVRPLSDDYYELVAGERRLKAALIAGLSEVPCVIKEVDDNTLKQIQLIENLQREDLNAYEETIGILNLLSLRLSMSDEEVISLLNRMEKADRIKGNKQADNVIRPEDIDIVNKVFALIGRLNHESFRANRLPLLNLPTDIQQALVSGKIEYTKARVIARVKDEQQRGKLLTEALAQDLSLSQIKELIQQLKTSTKEISVEKFVSQRVTNIGKRVKEVKIWDDTKKFKKLEKLLGDIEKLLTETE